MPSRQMWAAVVPEVVQVMVNGSSKVVMWSGVALMEVTLGVWVVAGQAVSSGVIINAARPKRVAVRRSDVAVPWVVRCVLRCGMGWFTRIVDPAFQL